MDRCEYQIAFDSGDYSRRVDLAKRTFGRFGPEKLNEKISSSFSHAVAEWESKNLPTTRFRPISVHRLNLG